MNTKADVRAFLDRRNIALAGVSRDTNAFSARVFEALKRKGYRLYAVNPKAASIGGEPCYPTLSSIPTRPGGVLLFTPPIETLSVVQEAYELGIRHVWIQQGADSAEAVAFCASHDMKSVTRLCILMFAEPIGFLHGLHRRFKRLLRTLPE
ncbi:MAG TPA: CoA-binding protein [Spirochaetia bacterium]|nr:CoA-binding protein [Spirochaetia bacterium]